jgi:hypothetical protein
MRRFFLSFYFPAIRSSQVVFRLCYVHFRVHEVNDIVFHSTDFSTFAVGENKKKEEEEIKKQRTPTECVDKGDIA